MKTLELLVCSDLHGSANALDTLAAAASAKRYDAVIVCGDFTTFGTTEYTKAFLKKLDTRVIAVPGNCDIPDTVSALEAANASVHNAVAEIDGWKFFGFGGGLPTTSGMPFELEEDILERSLRAIAVEEGIMVTHVPAYGMNDTLRSGHHGGSKGILRVAHEFKPVLALSGHIHESQGRVLSASTVFVNPGPARSGTYASVRLGDTVDVQFHGASKP